MGFMTWGCDALRAAAVILSTMSSASPPLPRHQPLAPEKFLGRLWSGPQLSWNSLGCRLHG